MININRSELLGLIGRQISKRWLRTLNFSSFFSLGSFNKWRIFTWCWYIYQLWRRNFVNWTEMDFSIEEKDFSIEEKDFSIERDFLKGHWPVSLVKLSHISSKLCCRISRIPRFTDFSEPGRIHCNFCKKLVSPIQLFLLQSFQTALTSHVIVNRML